MILYNIKKVKLTELDPSTGLEKESGIRTTLSTASECKLKPVTDDGDEDVLRTDDTILAIVRTEDLLYGYDITLTDNTFDLKCAELVAGYKVSGGEDDETKANVTTPMMSDGASGKQFKLEMYISNLEGDSIKNYVVITFNKCLGSFPEMDIGKDFFAPEFEIKARENTKAKLPIMGITQVDTLPE